MNIVGLSISQWLPCPLAILWLGWQILLNNENGHLKEHLILRRSQKRTTTTAEYRALPVHEGSTQRRWTEITSAQPRRGSSSGELWRRHPRWNAHICCRRRLKGAWHRVKVLLYLPALYLNIYEMDSQPVDHGALAPPPPRAPSTFRQFYSRHVAFIHAGKINDAAFGNFTVLSLA